MSFLTKMYRIIKEWPEDKSFYIFLFIVSLIGLIMNCIERFVYQQNSYFWEFFIYQIILFIIFYVSVKAWRFLAHKQKEIIYISYNTYFVYDDDDVLNKEYKRLFRNKRLIVFLFLIALSLSMYVLSLDNIRFSKLVCIYASLILTLTLFSSFFAGVSFVKLVLILRKTVNLKTEYYNKLYPISTPIFSVFRSAISIGLMYFWAVALLLIFLAISHSYVLSLKGITSSNLISIFKRYLSIVLRFLNAIKDGFIEKLYSYISITANNNDDLFGIWIILCVVIIIGSFFFSLYPYQILRSKILTLKMNSIYQISESTRSDEDKMKLVTFVNESPNWHKGTFFISTIPIIISLMVAVIQIIELSL